MGFYSPSQLLQDIRRHAVPVLPVCINASDWDFTLQQQGKAIRLGLRQVKGLSETGAKQLVKLRPEEGYRHIQQLRQYPHAKASGCQWEQGAFRGFK